MKDHEIFIVTARPNRFKKKTEDWFKIHFTNIPPIIYTGDFHKTNGGKKWEVCKQHSISVMIEDNSIYATDCAMQGIQTILFDTPWNQGIYHPNMKRVKSWPEAITFIESIANL